VSFNAPKAPEARQDFKLRHDRKPELGLFCEIGFVLRGKILRTATGVCARVIFTMSNSRVDIAKRDAD
jgi:hypothetical protein